MLLLFLSDLQQIHKCTWHIRLASIFHNNTVISTLSSSQPVVVKTAGCLSHKHKRSSWSSQQSKWPFAELTDQFAKVNLLVIGAILTYACLLAGSIGHRPKNATVFCSWPCCPFLSSCSPSLLFPFLYPFARCFVGYLFASSLRGSMWWLDGWWFLKVSWVYVLSTSICSSSFHRLVQWILCI